jgi:hypothetical protein
MRVNQRDSTPPLLETLHYPAICMGLSDNAGGLGGGGGGRCCVCEKGSFLVYSTITHYWTRV